jgi:hypothetical protein
LKDEFSRTVARRQGGCHLGARGRLTKKRRRIRTFLAKGLRHQRIGHRPEPKGSITDLTSG